MPYFLPKRIAAFEPFIRDKARGPGRRAGRPRRRRRGQRLRPGTDHRGADHDARRPAGRAVHRLDDPHDPDRPPRPGGPGPGGRGDPGLPRRAARRAGSRDPRDDLITYLAGAAIDGVPLSRKHQIGSAFLVLIAGADTTWSAIGSSLWHLATHDEDRAPPGRRPGADRHRRGGVPPGLRAGERGPDRHGGHRPARPPRCEAGERVLLAFAAANRDPDVFDDPDEIRIDRRRNRHLTFGSGAHRCLGSNLARLELRVTLEEWLRVMPDFRLAGPDGDRVERRADPRPGAGRLRGEPGERRRDRARPAGSPPGDAAPRPPAPLRGVRVVELAHWMAGPAAGGVLADWGADVVKVEPHGGEPMRHIWGSMGANPDAPNGAFTSANRGKRSVELDVRSRAGREALDRLLDRADVLLTNLRPAALTPAGPVPRRGRRALPAAGLLLADRLRLGRPGPGAGRLRPGLLLRPDRDRARDHHPGRAAGAADAGARRHVHRDDRGRRASSPRCTSAQQTGRGRLRGGVAAAHRDVGAGRGARRPGHGRPPAAAVPPGATARPRCTTPTRTADGRWFYLVGVEAARQLPKVLAAIGRPDLLDDERFALAAQRWPEEPP